MFSDVCVLVSHFSFPVRASLNRRVYRIWPPRLSFPGNLSAFSWQYSSGGSSDFSQLNISADRFHLFFEAFCIKSNAFIFMCLLKLSPDVYFSQYEFIGKVLPRYAILSHTCGEDDQEVSFEDIRLATTNCIFAQIKRLLMI